MGSNLVKKYLYFDVDFVDASELIAALNDAYTFIKQKHKKHNINDDTIKISVEPDGKQINMMYYDLADSSI